jgi:AAA+ ATPase superfamily predicted ATPase
LNFFRLLLFSAIVGDLILPTYTIFLPVLAAKLGASNFQVGLVGGANYLIYSFAPFIMGRLSDRIGRRVWYLVTSFAILSTSASIYVVAPNVSVILLARLLEGIGWSMLWPNISSGIVESSQSSPSASLGIYNYVWSASAMMGPIFSGILFAFLPVRYGLLICAVCFMFILALDACFAISNKKLKAIPYANSWRRGMISLFDTRPKEDRSLLYGREKELDDIGQALESGFWPLLIGAPRVGKTSLLKVLVKERKGIYLDASTSATAADLGFRLFDELQGGKLKHTVQLDFKLLKVELRREPVRTLEKVMKGMGDTLVAIDEAQNLNDSRIPGLLSVLYNESRVKLMFSGSMLRMIKLIERSPQTLGRPIQKMEISPFSEETSRGFLETGFKKCGVQTDKVELSEAARALGGIPGWLSYYGARRCAHSSQPTALRQVTTSARKVIEEEVKRLGPLEQAIVRSLAMIGAGEWKRIMALTSSFYGKEPDRKSLTRSLASLVDMRIVEKTADGYRLIDPMYRILESSSGG